MITYDRRPVVISTVGSSSFPFSSRAGRISKTCNADAMVKNAVSTCLWLNAFLDKYYRRISTALCSYVSQYIPSAKTKGYSCWVSNIGVKCAVFHVSVGEELLRVGIIQRVAKNVPTKG